MTDEPLRNQLSWRVNRLEKQIETLEAGQPAVMAERVGMLSQRVSELRAEFIGDIADLRGEMRERDQAREKQIRSFQRIFVSVFTGVGVAVAVAVIAQFAIGGTP